MNSYKEGHLYEIEYNKNLGIGDHNYQMVAFYQGTFIMLEYCYPDHRIPQGWVRKTNSYSGEPVASQIDSVIDHGELSDEVISWIKSSV